MRWVLRQETHSTGEKLYLNVLLEPSNFGLPATKSQTLLGCRSTTPQTFEGWVYCFCSSIYMMSAIYSTTNRLLD
ncbi:MAG: hypothetical protein LBF72_02395 [Holosporales bacterium]|nr:hypothetical protein [Holosporales bacterium]